MDSLVFTLGVRIIIGFIATFISIILWSRTREIPWIFVVLGVFFLFVKDIVEVALLFGLNNFYSTVLWGIEIVPLALNILPYLFFILAMVIFLVRHRRY